MCTDRSLFRVFEKDSLESGGISRLPEASSEKRGVPAPHLRVRELGRHPCNFGLKKPAGTVAE